MTALCQCDQSTGRCTVCGVEDAFCGSPRSCPAPSRLISEPAPDLARTDAPSFLEKVRNFASATVQHVAAGMPMASDEEIIRRHDICLTCEHLQNDACNLCGCPVSRVAGYVSKLSWADQSCPAGKWGPVSPPDTAQ